MEAADEDQLTKKNSQVAQPLHPSPEDLKKFDIIRATQYGAFERCKELIEAGYDVNQMDRENVSLLHWAAINNRKEIVKYYLSKNAIVDKFGGDLNSTPLHWATRQGHVSMVVVLMSYGADPSLYDGEGCSCIHLASQFGHTAIVAYLIAKGQDVDMLDRNGMTPLMWAAYRVFNFDPTRLLLTFGAKVNLADKLQKNTPLHWACQYSNHVIIKILVEAGGNLEAVNAKDQTPLDIAITLKNTSLVSWLRESRAERGLGQKHCLQVLSSNKSVRYSVMAAFPFTALFFIGFIPELTIGWYYKLTLALFAVGIGRITINLFFDHTFTTVIPQFVTLATIFWLYITWIIYLWPYVFSQTALLFALNTAVMVYNLWKVWMTDPGFIVSTREEKIKTIMDFAETQNLNLNEFCSTCVIRRPMRSKHCAVCNKCVAKLDHHCPWVDNCVGALNHKYFLGFLFFVLGALLIYLHSCFLFWAKTCPWNFYEEGITGMLYKILITSPWIAWMATNALAHIIWVTALLCCQLYQIMWLAMTTNERLNIHRYEHFQYQHPDGRIEYKNPFHRGCLKNLNDVLGWRCCGICRPRVIDWRKSTESEETTKQFSHVHATRENFQFV